MKRVIAKRRALSLSPHNRISLKKSKKISMRVLVVMKSKMSKKVSQLWKQNLFCRSRIMRKHLQHPLDRINSKK